MKKSLVQLQTTVFSTKTLLTPKIICSLLLLFFANNIIAQIQLEKVIPNTKTPVKYVNFSLLGEKFVVNNDTGTTYRIYNSDFSLYKTISIPKLEGYQAIKTNHISDNLFNSDSKIEFGIFYQNFADYTFANKYIVYSEDGSSLFEIDSIYPSYNYNGGINFINENKNESGMYCNTATGWKLFALTYSQPVSPNNSKVEVYSLPGTMPKITSSLNPRQEVPFNLSFPYPNPSSTSASINFKLPESLNEGEIVIYNEQGTIMKTLRVDNTFGMVLLNNSSLPAGTYYYLMKAGNSISDTKKMVVIP
ncbi:T9SS type A sorting domain-containing protein [Sporocytophaga myxococcoides]|nr:T9SS type A sorting domain-containing protein [Sporocytophaga myxococcoides]